eukprot:TRINITY_DN26773_c0_g2_i1.p1 TRINITY_DN26773_c0_g2~~TRINITY_DN26773_c0_g2_i1.p1  ORF type:complete len:534 (-),score=75.58 TRINITY_DN26773_c0_g2_i1:86-1687(-)
MAFQVLVLCLLTAAVSVGDALDQIQIGKHGRFIDSHGRTRIFHGVNVVYKQYPWYPSASSYNAYDSLVEDDMEKLADCGFNVVRLGVMWPGVESAPGTINETYLHEISRLTLELARHGVYTLVDLHQDLLSRHFCGEGVPEGYVEALLRDNTSSLSKARPFPEPVAMKFALDTDGFPNLTACLKDPLFADYYSSEQVGALFEQLYTEGTPLNTGFLRYWEAVAGTFGKLAGEANHILGYELLNEPSGYCLDARSSTCGKKPGPVFNDRLEVQYLTPLYRAAAARIRAADAHRPIFYEATAYPMLLASPFPVLPLGEDAQQGLAYHIYCQADMSTVWDQFECRAAQGLSYREYFGFLNKHDGLGSFMTEFGAIGQTTAEYDEIDRLLSAADANMQSWSYWQLKQFHDITTANAAESLYDEHGQLESAKLKLLSRTYAQAIGGDALHMSFQSTDALFELEYNASVTTAPTEIYLNEAMHYPQGYITEIDPPECIRQETQLNRLHLHLRTDTAQSCVGRRVKLRISRKGSLAEVLV